MFLSLLPLSQYTYVCIYVSGTKCPCHYNNTGFHTYILKFEEDLLISSLIAFSLNLHYSWQKLSKLISQHPQSGLFTICSASQLCWLHRLSHCTTFVPQPSRQPLDSRTARSNKSETCLGASFIKRPNLPRPFRLIADLQKMLIM